MEKTNILREKLPMETTVRFLNDPNFELARQITLSFSQESKLT